MGPAANTGQGRSKLERYRGYRLRQGRNKLERYRLGPRTQDSSARVRPAANRCCRIAVVQASTGAHRLDRGTALNAGARRTDRGASRRQASNTGRRCWSTAAQPREHGARPTLAVEGGSTMGKKQIAGRSREGLEPVGKKRKNSSFL
jgi:hypothetical protein